MSLIYFAAWRAVFKSSANRIGYAMIKLVIEVHKHEGDLKEP